MKKLRPLFLFSVSLLPVLHILTSILLNNEVMRFLTNAHHNNSQQVALSSGSVVSNSFVRAYQKLPEASRSHEHVTQLVQARNQDFQANLVSQNIK